MNAKAEPKPGIDGSPKADRTDLTWPKRIAIVFTLLGVYAPFFFYFLVPSELLWWCFSVIGAVSAIPLVVFSLQALFRLRWKSISIFALVWVLLGLCFVGPLEPQEWLRVLGFYIHTRLNDYPSRCRLTEFDENGVKQTVGFCEGFDRGQFFEDIVYDTTSEFVRPVLQRTPEWKRAMSGATVKAVLSKERRAYRLFGNYYCVYVDILDLEG